MGEAITHADCLQLMHTIFDLFFPWSVDLAVHNELQSELLDHLNRVGVRLWLRLQN